MDFTDTKAIPEPEKTAAGKYCPPQGTPCTTDKECQDVISQNECPGRYKWACVKIDGVEGTKCVFRKLE